MKRPADKYCPIFGDTDGTTFANPIDFGAGLKLPVASKTAAYTVTDSDFCVLCNATGAAFTVTLPTAAGRTGRVYAFVKIDSTTNAVTIGGYGSETINGSANTSLSSQWAKTVIISDGSNWVKLV